MWSKSVELLNLYEALKESNKKKKHENKEVGMIRWRFMTKWQKLMYSIPIFHRNKHRLHLGNGYILNFETMTIDIDE